MATIVSLASQTYTPRTINRAFTSGELAGVTIVTITLQRAAWLAGLCAEINVDWGTSKASGFLYGTDARWPDGPAKVVMGKPVGATSGQLNVIISQAITTPVLVEGA